ncbi:MAG TPA: NUDIX hydrolase [Pseudolabrys sp.]|jgi:hypothetical protein|nr:NUDIX hydrolase [Pseudolabrys sp.]
MSAGITIVHSDRLELSFSPKPWVFAEQRAIEIDALFAAMRVATPALWNGRVLMLHDYSYVDGVFRGDYLETDFASFRAWHDWGCPGAPIYDSFGAAAILTADNAFILGIMGAQTANAGRIYFPCGTPDPDDIIQGKVDLDLSVRRELREETGLEARDFAAEPGWTTVIAGPMIAQIKVLRSWDNAASLQARIREHIARDPKAELAGTSTARGLKDLTPSMPDFVTAFLKYRWAGNR